MRNIFAMKGGLDFHKGFEPVLSPMHLDAKVVDFWPEKVVVPLLQHIGDPCKAIVTQGDRVKMGQKIGEAQGFVSAPVHASVSGEVLFVGERALAGEKRGQVIVIGNDYAYEYFEGIERDGKKNDAPMDKELIRTIIREAGIVGMGGAAFPTQVKLSTEGKKIQLLIINGAECEPLLSADAALMEQNGDAIKRGCLYAMRAVECDSAIIGIENNKSESIRIMQELCQDDLRLHVETLPARYPEGSEKQLIQRITGREVPENGLPADVGVIVINVSTAAAIADAVEKKMPLISRICTVTGDIMKPQNIRFPIGTLVSDLIDFAGGFAGKPSKVILGGPMMGQTLDDLDVPLTKGSSGVVAINEEHDEVFREDPCIRCNRCVDVCPMALLPLRIDYYARKGRLDQCKRFYAKSCINCGCCSYICPARRRLAENITKAKEAIVDQERGQNNGV